MKEKHAKKEAVIAVLLVFVLLFSGCSNAEFTRAESEEKESFEIKESNDESNLIGEGRFFRIYSGNKTEDRFYYFYDILDENGEVLLHECTYADCPEISVLSDGIVRIKAQAGIGRGSEYTYYYDVKERKRSPAYYYVLCDCDTLVAYFDGENVAISDLYDEGIFHKEILLKETFADTKEPICGAQFSNDLHSVTIEYLTSENFEEAVETVDFR